MKNLDKLREEGFSEVSRYDESKIIMENRRFRVVYNSITDEIGDCYEIGVLKTVEEHNQDKSKFDIQGFYLSDGNFDAEG